MTQNTKALILKIVRILDNRDADGQAELLAEQYVGACTRVNERLEHFISQLNAGHYYAAIEVAQVVPSLNQQLDGIRFPRESEWNQYCERAGYRTFDGFNTEHLRKFKEVTADMDAGQPEEYREYRKSIILKDDKAALNALRELNRNHPSDKTAYNELTTLESREFARIEKGLENLLAQGDEKAIVKQVKLVKAESWVIPMESTLWQQSEDIYNKHTLNQKTELIDSLLQQLTVIRRLGSWRDASKLIKNLEQLKGSSEYKSQPTEIQATVQDNIDWYYTQSEQSQPRAEDPGKALAAAFAKKLDRSSLEKKVKQADSEALRQMQSELKHDWDELGRKSPESATKLELEYRDAQQLLASKRKSKVKKKRKPLEKELQKSTNPWILPLIALLMLSASLLIFIHQREGSIASEVDLLYSANKIESTRKALVKWDRFTFSFFSRYNPFRNHRANEAVENIRLWIVDLDTRNERIHQFLDEIRTSIEQPLSIAEINRLRTNLETAELLAGEVPAEWKVEFSRQIPELESKLDRAFNEGFAKIRNEIEAEIAEIRSIVDERLAFDQVKIPVNIEGTLNALKSRVDDLKPKLLAWRDNEGLADQMEALGILEAHIERFHEGVDGFENLSLSLNESLSLDEYLDNIEQLHENPLVAQPTVIASNEIHTHANQLRNLQQSLLMPNNELAWREFIRNLDRPLVPADSDAKELAAFRAWVNHAWLGDIHQYQVVNYRNGQKVDDGEMIYTFGQIEVESRGNGAQVLLIQNARIFADNRVGTDTPFNDTIFECMTASSGAPINGVFLVYQRITPESSFYQQLPVLSGFEESSERITIPLLEVLDIIREDRFIHPLFKAYLTQGLIQVMIVRAYDWGLNFSPDAQIDYKILMDIQSRFFPYDWLRPSIRNQYTQALVNFYDRRQSWTYMEQAIAGRELFKVLEDQRIRYAGYIDLDGLPFIIKNTPQDRKLFGLNEKGEVVTLRNFDEENGRNDWIEDGMRLTPLLYFNDRPELILQRVGRNSGVDVLSEEYKRYLPPIFL